MVYAMVSHSHARILRISAHAFSFVAQFSSRSAKNVGHRANTGTGGVCRFLLTDPDTVLVAVGVVLDRAGGGALAMFSSFG